MARGSVNYNELKVFMDKLEQAQKMTPEFAQAMAKDLAKKLLRIVRMRTPVDTGDLRRGWDTEPVEYGGYVATIRVYNPVEYAIYVEAGHRTRDHKSYVPGVHMLATSTAEIQEKAPALIERKLYKWLMETLG